MSLVFLENRFLGFRKPMSLVEDPSLDPLLPEPKRRKIDPEIKDRSFDLLNQGLQIMSGEALSLTKRFNSETSWLDDKKLHLVLDLDHTLVHTIRTPLLSESDTYLTEEADSRNDLWRFDSGLPSEFLIKLRPFVHQFLKEASDMFSMSVYTKGGPDYARVVLDLIDPDKTYFGDRVISRRESPGTKTLDLVLADERGIVIVDDKRRVWPRHQKNLLQIAKYEYFRESNESDSSSSECKRDESDEKGPLASVLRFLKDVHEGFFCDLSEQELDSMDVRPLLREPSSRSEERKRKIPAGSGLKLIESMNFSFLYI